MITVVVGSYKRLNQITNFIDVTSKISVSFELIIVGNYQEKLMQSLLSQLPNHIHGTYIKSSVKSASVKKNIGISKARSRIIAFTDDDCVINSKWIETIEKLFNLHKNVDGVFGKTLPYQSEKHKSEICPCTTPQKNRRIITTPCYHSKYLGYGNNLAFRKSALYHIGLFKQWLGPGSIGSNADDAEIAMRALIKKHTLLYEPQLRLHHNKWLTKNQMDKQRLSYICGEMSCYGYFMFLGYSFARDVIKENIRESARSLKTVVYKLITFQLTHSTLHCILRVGFEHAFRVRGLLVGLLFSIIDPFDPSSP